MSVFPCLDMIPRHQGRTTFSRHLSSWWLCLWRDAAVRIQAAPTVSILPPRYAESTLSYNRGVSPAETPTPPVMTEFYEDSGSAGTVAGAATATVSNPKVPAWGQT